MWLRMEVVVADYCEHDDEHSGFLKSREFVD
jgi:hypothetical protein